MKKAKQHQIIDHRVEITEIDGEYYVVIDGLPLTRPSQWKRNELPRQAKFTTAANAFRAAEMAIQRNQKGFLV